MLNSLFYCPSRIHSAKERKENSSIYFEWPAEGEKTRDNVCCTIIVVIKCRCIRGAVFENTRPSHDCLRLLAKASKPRGYLSQHRKKGNPEDMLGKKWVMSRKAGNAYKLPHLFRSWKFRLKFIPWAFGEKFENDFSRNVVGFQVRLLVRRDVKGAIVIDVDREILLQFSSVFQSASWFWFKHFQFNRFCQSTPLVEAPPKENLWIYVWRINSPVIANAKHVEAQKEFKKSVINCQLSPGS